MYVSEAFANENATAAWKGAVTLPCARISREHKSSSAQYIVCPPGLFLFNTYNCIY